MPEKVHHKRYCLKTMLWRIRVQGALIRKMVRLLGVFFIVLAILNSCLFWLVPDLIRQQIQLWNQQHPKSMIQVSSVHWRSWPWRLELDGVRAFDGSKPWLQLRQAVVGVRPFSLLHRHIHVSLLRLVDGSVDLDHQPQGWNVQRILALQSPPGHSAAHKSSGWGWSIGYADIRDVGMQVQYPEIGWTKPFHFVVHHVQLTDLESSGSDAAPLELHLQNLNQDDNSGSLYGRVRIQLQPLDFGVDVVLAHVELADIQPLLQKMPIKIESGVLNHLHVVARLQQQNQLWKVSLPDLGLDLHGLRVLGTTKNRDQPEQHPQLSFDDLQVKHLQVDPDRHLLALDGVFSRKLSIHAHQSGTASVDVLDLVHGLMPPSPSGQPAWGVQLKHVDLRDASLFLSTHQDPEAHVLNIEHMNIDVPSLDTRNKNAGWPVHVSFQGGLGRWQISGSINPQHLLLDWQSNDGSLDRLNPWLPAGMNGLQGRFSSQGQLKGNILAEDASVHVEPLVHNMHLSAQGGQLVIQQVSAHLDWNQSGQELWGEAQLKGLSLAQNQRQLSLNDLVINGLHHKGVKPDLSVDAIHATEVHGSQPGFSSTLADFKSRKIQWNDHILSVESINLDHGLASWSTDVPNRFRFGTLQLLNSEVDLATSTAKTGLKVAGLNWHGHRHWFRDGAIAEPAVFLNWQQHQLRAGDLSVLFSSMYLALDAKAKPQFLDDLPHVPAAPQVVTKSASQSTAKSWHIRVQSVRTQIAHVRFEDRSLLSHPVQLGVVRLHTSVIDSQRGSRSVHAVVHLADGGRVAWRGSVGMRPIALNGLLHVNAIPLHIFQPLLDTQTDLVAAQGHLNIQGMLGFDASGLSFQGGFHVDDASLENRAGLPMLSWSEVHEPLVSLQGKKITLGTLLIDHPYALVRINPDKTLNWNQMIHPGPLPSQSHASVAAVSTTSNNMVVPVRLQGVQLVESAIDFTDASLPSPFHVLLHHLDGQLGELNSQLPDQWSALHLQGRVNQFGKVQMDGKIQPMRTSPKADVRMSLRDLEMPTLNPYAMALAGYRIDQGMLNLQLQYTLDQGRVDGKNHFRIDQLQLGPRIGGANAPDLPLKLAVDVLRNSDGVIDLDVPVYGNLNDPDFSLRQVVMAAIGSSLKHIVDSPITLLSHLLGESEDALHHVAFEPGSYVLNQETRDRIGKMSKVLIEHQHLLVFVRASYDPVLDSPKGQQGVLLTPEMLRDLAIHRAESVKSAFMAHGVHDHRIFIAEPGMSDHRGTAASVVTTIEIRAR